MMDSKTKSGTALVEQQQLAHHPSTTSGALVGASGPTATSATGGACRVSTRTKTVEAEEAAKDVVLMREEERILDEEITSDEEDAEVTAAKMERNLVTVALVKSVVETSGGTEQLEKPLSVKVENHSSSTVSSEPDPDSPRYGLRKRRRPAGDDLKRLEHFQATTEGGLARTNTASVTSTLVGRIKGEGKPRRSTTSTHTSQARAGPTPPVPIRKSSPVPNPLAFATSIAQEDQARSNKVIASSNADSLVPAVPCPLPGDVKAETVVSANTIPTESVPPPVAAASSNTAAEASKRKVTISESVPKRARGFSIDLDSMGLDFPVDGSSTSGEGDLALPSSGGRGRAFSFECFAFGINADEPLPPLQDDSSSMGRPRQDSLVADQYNECHPGRPRGDSIIFDPSSFQDGGIHEQSALEKSRAPGSDIPGLGSRPSAPRGTSADARPDSATSCPAPLPPKTTSSTSHNTKANPPTTKSFSSTSGPASSPSTLPAVTSYTATTTTTTNSSTTTTVTITASTASMSMELLNKDGRIGIYLPEARKARIARFHAKRARRIWRKRIKYDCRKKLADSRPRIKGRFVKRSDMEDE